MKLSEILELLSDAWVEAEVETNETPPKKFRIDYFTRLEQKLHNSGIKCDYDGCKKHV